jgi:predicted DNA-binding transcriptional regulator YafY
MNDPVRGSSIAGVLLRQMAMLRMLPRYPRQIGTAELRARLAELGFATTARTIQRDLPTLATFFAIECHNGTKPYGWRWRRDAALFEVPPMDRDTALALLVGGAVLHRALPEELSNRLEPHLAHARHVLGVDAADWSRKFRAIGRRRPPRVLDAIVRALLEERCVRCTYEGREGSVRTHHVHPIALILRENGGELVCTLDTAPQITTLLARRVRAAELLSAPRVVPPDFDLDAFLGQAPRAG